MAEQWEETFYSFHGEILSKKNGNGKTTTQLTKSAIWSIFANLNTPLSPKFPDIDALSIWT